MLPIPLRVRSRSYHCAPSIVLILFSLQRVAKLAVDASKPVEIVSDALLKLRAQLREYPNQGQALSQGLLPIIYANLDPARLLDPDRVAEPIFLHRALCATRAMTMLRMGHLPTAVARELWPRLWAWIQFFDNHDYFPDDAPFTADRRLLFSCFLPFLHDTEGNAAQLVYTTPDVCVFVSHAWACLVARCERYHDALQDPGSQGAMLALVQMFRVCHRFPQHFDELVEGMGNSEDLARLAVRYTAVAARNFDIVEHTRRDRLDPTLYSGMISLNWGGPSFLECLGSAGMAKVLTETLIKLAGAGFTMAATGRCLLPLVDIVDQLGAPSLVKALKAGLLRAIISRHASESDSDDERVSRALKHLIRDILVDATFKYSFMVALKSVLPDALAIERTGGFMHSPRWEDWKLFTVIAAERLQYAEEFRAGYVSTRECSNFEVSLGFLVQL